MSKVANIIQRIIELEAEGPQTIAAACRLRRDLGAEGFLSRDDLPREWTDKARQHFAWTCNLYAKVPAEVFEQWITDGVGSVNFSRNYLRKKAMRHQRDQKRIADRALPALTVSGGHEIYVADISTVISLRHEGQVSAIITDPPYGEGALPLWGELLTFANRVLMDHGWLVAMSGQKYLPRTLNEIMCVSGALRYVWTLALHLPGPSSQTWIDTGNCINGVWKPIFVLSKGTPQKWPDHFQDFLISPHREKDIHAWGQNLAVFTQLVEHFSLPGTLVVDPFLGGGTTAVAAAQSGRVFEGFDIDEHCVIDSRQRLNAVTLVGEAVYCGDNHQSL